MCSAHVTDILAKELEELQEKVLCKVYNLNALDINS